MKPYYQAKGITIYNGDCREVLATVSSADAVLTDPPYGVKLAGKVTKHHGPSGIGYLSIDDSPDYVATVVVPVIVECIRRFGRVAVTPGNRNLFRYPEPRDIGCAFYPNGAGRGPWGFNCFNPILFYGKDPYLAKGLGSRPNSFKDTRAAERSEHPCPKPIYWMEWMVNRCSFEGETVLDPFMGSGTTLVAAQNLNRKAIGIELEEKYCEIAARRLESPEPLKKAA